MICFKDKTFCASPNCKNECGRKMTPREEIESDKAGLPVSYSDFCAHPLKPVSKREGGSVSV